MTPHISACPILLPCSPSRRPGCRSAPRSVCPATGGPAPWLADPARRRTRHWSSGVLRCRGDAVPECLRQAGAAGATGLPLSPPGRARVLGPAAVGPPPSGPGAPGVRVHGDRVTENGVHDRPRCFYGGLAGEQPAVAVEGGADEPVVGTDIRSGLLREREPKGRSGMGGFNYAAFFLLGVDSLIACIVTGPMFIKDRGSHENSELRSPEEAPSMRITTAGGHGNSGV